MNTSEIVKYLTKQNLKNINMLSVFILCLYGFNLYLKAELFTLVLMFGVRN